MASVISERHRGRMRYRIQFRNADGKRKSIRLAAANKRTASAIASKVEALNHCRIAGEAPSPALSEWLRTLGDELHRKLAGAGLVETRQSQRPTTLAAYVDDYIERKRSTVEPQTLRNYFPFANLLIERFGADRSLESISAGDADDFRTYLVGRYAEATMSKRIKQSRELFRQAVKDRIIETSPFAEVAAGNEANAKRQHYVSVADSLRLIEEAPDSQWRLIIVLARFLGLRTPSETLRLRWQDIDWEGKRILIHSPKTSRKGKPHRVCPLFPEVESYLSEAFTLAPDGSTHCITRYRKNTANLRTQLHRYIDRAGLERWPRAFHNLRASLETDLNDRFPAHVVASWIGNTPRIADRHYNMTTDAHFARAIVEGGARGGAASRRNHMQPAEGSDTNVLENKAHAVFSGFQLPAEYPREDSNL